MRSEARACAYDAVRRTFEQGAYTDRVIHAAADLEPRERALAVRLAYGTVQRRGTLDHLIGLWSDRRLDPPLQAALRLGIYELLWTASAPHAILNDVVELAKEQGGGPGYKLVNAVLRRATRDGERMLGGLSDEDPRSASVKHSMPEWITQMWWERLGGERTRALLVRCNEPAERSLRANTLRTDALSLAAALPVDAHAAGDPPEAVIVEQAFDAHADPRWRAGDFTPQSRAAMLVARALDPQPGERVLDMCAAPGAKTTHLAALMGGRGEIVAVERHTGRARALERTAARMGAGNVRVVVGDAGEHRGRYERILLDPPCTGLGTLQSRPDLRWRATPESQTALVGIQARLLSAAAEMLTPGGTLVYSTCTISPPENEEQMQRCLEEHPDLTARSLAPRFPAWADPGPFIQSLPSVQGSDGFFIAALERTR
ncbi:MAG: 16S rRNA (cytosine(967)-C(5))-methyltransferase RsmB [Solirubrobacteraceae bacterium]